MRHFSSAEKFIFNQQLDILYFIRGIIAEGFQNVLFMTSMLARGLNPRVHWTTAVQWTWFSFSFFKIMYQKHVSQFLLFNQPWWHSSSYYCLTERRLWVQVPVPWSYALCHQAFRAQSGHDCAINYKSLAWGQPKGSWVGELCGGTGSC